MSVPPAPEREGNAVAAFITLVASAASVCLVLTAHATWDHAAGRTSDFVAFVVLAFVLQLLAVNVYGRGSISVAGLGFLAVGFTFGAGAAMMVALATGTLHAVRKRGKLHRSIFDAASFSLSAGAGGAVYHAIAGAHWSASARLGPALAGGVAFWLVNIGLLSIAMGLSEGIHPTAVWRERFRWLTPHYLTFGPLALALVVAFERLGITGLVAFALPPALLMVSVRQYLEKTRESVEEIRRTNIALAERNEDLRELFEFAGGLAARAHDRGVLVAYAERELARLTGTGVRFSADPEEGEIPLAAGGVRVGSLELEDAGLDVERWGRLREAIVPQLATAIESAELVEQVRKKHLATIAALSRSMEAKDFYTGGHTERVAEVAVALGRRLGYTGADLDAIEIGALLHDIGKIGIPERILHKPGPLDDEEWRVMKEHPVISDYILSEVDLHPFVRQIARSSHERIDGAGYPDGLAGNAIPLPARIALVADAFDALTTDRPYRRGMSAAAALDEVREHTGAQFCPTVVAALERVWREEPHLLGAGHLRAVEVA